MDTVVSQFPSNFNTIAEAYFEDPNIQSQFKKDMDRNLKIASGIDPDTSNEEIADQLNLDNDDIINRGTEDAMLKNDDPTALNLMARNMEVLGAMNKSNPEISPVQLFTQKDLADRYDFSDIYKISFTNSETDPALYETKANLAVEQIYEAMDNLEPNYMRYAFRFIGQPAASIGLSTVGKGWGKVALGATADTVGPAWDMAALGDTIYNTQERYNQELYAMIDDDSMTLEQFNENMKKFIEKIVTEVPSEYQHEIFDSFIEGPNPFADAGASFTNAGIHGFTRVMGKVIPAKALARSAFQIGKLLTGRAKNTGAANFNRSLMNQISKTMSNKVDDVAVDEAAKAKTASTMPEGTTPDDIELANSINKNKEVDKNLVKNSNEDRFWSDLKVSQEDINTHNTPTSGANRTEEDVTTLNMIVPGYAKENMIIRHGKGVNNDVPFSSLEEAKEAMNLLQSHYKEIPEFDSKGFRGHTNNPYFNEEPDYIAFTSASVKPWDANEFGDVKPDFKNHYREGEGSAVEGLGVYASDVAGYEASRNKYLNDVHQRKAEKLSQIYNEDEILKRKDFKDSANKINIDTLSKRVKSSFLDALALIQKPQLEDYDLKEINLENGYLEDLKKYLSDFNGEDLIVKLDDVENNIEEMYNDFYYEGAVLEDLKEFERKIAVRETIAALLRDGNDSITSYLHTFTGKNPYKYPDKYIFNGMVYEPEVYGEYLGPINNAHKKAIETFNKWKTEIKQEALDKGYYPPHGYGKRRADSKWDRSDWYKAISVVSGLEGEKAGLWYRDKLNELGFSASLHSHHDGTLNIVTINDNDFSPITKMENNINVVDYYNQQLYNNGYGIVRSDDGTGYYVIEVHLIKDAKPIIIDNFKIKQRN